MTFGLLEYANETSFGIKQLGVLYLKYWGTKWYLFAQISL